MEDNEDIDEEKINDEEQLQYCSICHKNTFDTIAINNSKRNKILKELLQSIDFSELIKKCNCKNNSNYLYVHKFCILLKILYKYETKCEKCKADYNINIVKKFDKKRFIKLFLFFLFIYIIHLFVFLFCMFLLFINVILKEYMKKNSNKFIQYKHIFIFFGIVIFIINSFFLFYTIIINIKFFKINIYKYIIDILDFEEKKEKNEKKEKALNILLEEFLEWGHFQPMKYLISDISKKYFFNRIYSSYLNEVNNFIDKNNSEYYVDFHNIKIISADSKFTDGNNNYLWLNNNMNNYNANNNPNYLNLNNIFNKQSEEINFSSNLSSKLNNEGNDNENSNNIIINSSNNNSNFFTRGKKNNQILGSLKLSHTMNDFINININPKTSKNINININFSNEKISQIEQFSSSKDYTGRANSRRNSKIGKTALIPKKLMMTNIMAEQNIFKRKKRQLQSIKLKRNILNLKNTQITGNIDEEIDFSSFDGMGSHFSKGTGGSEQQKNFSSRESRCSNFKTKKSFKDVDLNISKSRIGEEEEEQNIRNSRKSNNSIKHVHFDG